jgi:hypothetical protein
MEAGLVGGWQSLGKIAALNQETFAKEVGLDLSRL